MKYKRPEARARLFKQAWEADGQGLILLLCKGFVQHVWDNHVSHVCASFAKVNYNDAMPVDKKTWVCPGCHKRVPDNIRCALTLQQLDI